MEREQLIRARQAHGWSQEELAEQVGVDVASISRWEQGKSKPRAAHRLRLCEVLGMNAEELGLDAHPKKPLENNIAALKVLTQQDLTLRFLKILHDWPQQNVQYHDLQSLITEETAMAAAEQLSRRSALRRLALIPIDLYGLTALTSSSSALKNIPEVLKQCAAGITACYSLAATRDAAMVAGVISSYIPTLTRMVETTSSAQRRATADLLTQSLLLKALMNRFVDGRNDAVTPAKQAAETYSLMAKNPTLHIVSLRTLASMYTHANRHDMALLYGQKAESLLPQFSTIPWRVHSHVYVELARDQAYRGLFEQAKDSLFKSQQAFERSVDEDLPLWIDHGEGNQYSMTGIVQTALGLYEDARNSQAKVQHVPTAGELMRVGALIDGVMAEVQRDDKPRDMDWAVEQWSRAAVRTRALRSEQRFNGLHIAYAAMRAAWPTEKRVKDLREQLVHW